jgi:cytochrome c oxidase assembly protein subunit 15
MGMTTFERGALGALVLVLVIATVLAVGRRAEALQRLAGVTALLVFVLVVFGAYVRLSDAGLGCPDWPGCYGDLTPAAAHHSIGEAERSAPGGPVTMAKAWKEMLHRYLAMLVGCLILAQAIVALRLRDRGDTLPALAWTALIVVILQAAFGALTVTMRLMPVIVTTHLVGGMLTLLLVTAYALRAGRGEEFVAVGSGEPSPAGLRRLGALVLALLFVQLALGGWVSTNYAAPVCGTLPDCQGRWWPEVDFRHGFEIVRELGQTADGAGLPLAALTAIHLTHRLFAIVVASAAIVLGIALWRAGRRAPAAALWIAVGTQIAIGLKVVWAMSSPHLELPLQLPAAAAHNAGAAVLVVVLAWINVGVLASRRPPRSRRVPSPLSSTTLHAVASRSPAR